MRTRLAKNPGGVPLELVRKLLWCPGWIGSHKQVNVIRHALQGLNVHLQLACLFTEQCFQTHRRIPHKNLAPIFRTPNEMSFERKQIASVRFVSRARHRTIVLQVESSDNFNNNQGVAFHIPLSPCIFSMRDN
jgi:hypothetical protein